MRGQGGFYRRLLALACGLGLASAAWAGPFSGMFVFGDSLSDSGNDLALTQGVLASPFPAPTVYTDGTTTGRFTNGLNYADHLAASLGVSLTPSEKGGTNYAYGGARVNYASDGLPEKASFTKQVSAYLNSHAPADPNALYVLWIGANDMSDALKATLSGTPGAVPAAINTVMTGLGGAIGQLAGIGAQHFLIPNLPDLSLIPEVRELNNPLATAGAHQSSLAFNVNLTSTLANPAFGALDIRTLDTFAAQTEITADPGKFGFTNVTSACFSGNVDGSARAGVPLSTCADPASYLYWDYEHPTAALHTALAERALAAVVPEPETWALMLAGIGVLVVARRKAMGGSRRSSMG